MNERFELIPSGADLGAEIRGLDLRAPLPPPVLDAVRDAFPAEVRRVLHRTQLAADRPV